ncbi:GTP cyclohydrolase I FolE2 [bacterium]|nr:GTP cyclohydrolase I FolE2 [bacterium]
MDSRDTLSSDHLPDVQEWSDSRGIDIEKVGVSEIRIPLQLREKGGGIQRSVGEVALSVALPGKWKGTHMSRFTQLLNTFTQNPDHTFASGEMVALASMMLEKLGAQRAFVEVSVDFFMNVEAPETGLVGVAPYVGLIEVEVVREDEGDCHTRVFTGVEVQGQTCCPCSREISDFDPKTGKGRGAHSQHGDVHILVEAKAGEMIWFEDLIEIAISSLSAPSYPILKRIDERAATIQAYDNPCFVEDVVRNAALQLRSFPGISWFEVEVLNHEVIHFHKAFARIQEDVT